MVATGVYLVRNTDLFLSRTKHTYWEVWKSSAQQSHKTIRCFRPLPTHEKRVQKFSLYSLYVKVHMHHTLVDTRISFQLFFHGDTSRKICIHHPCQKVQLNFNTVTQKIASIGQPIVLRLDLFRIRRRALIKSGDINEVADLHFLSCPFRILNKIARESSENCENNLETLSQTAPSFSKFKYK